MKKNKFFSIIICFLFISLVLLSSLSPKRAYAVEKEDDKDKVYCPLCVHRDDEDPLYKKERQFYQKIHIIKSVFKNSIDEVALAASVLHRYSSDDVAYEKEYDVDFNENDYKNTWNDISGVRTDLASFFKEEGDTKIHLSSTQKAAIEQNEKISLLTTAAIVMIDSNHGKTYSDVCFKDALAGNQLVNNDGNSGVFGDFVNAFVCNGEIVIGTPLDFLSNFFNGDNILISKESAKNKFVNTQKVCKNGYVGGLYNGVSRIKDETQKENIKKLYAQQIIDLANYYKRLYGSGIEEYGDSCSADIAGATGEFASWRQKDPKWGEIPLGNSYTTVKNAGCLVTSISMQIARSGTKIGSLPGGYSEFNPGAFVTSSNAHNAFDGEGNYGWTGFQTIAPNWGVDDHFVKLGVSSNEKLAEAVSRELSSGFGSEQYQKFLVLKIHHKYSEQHWVAVNGVENGIVTIFDPASDGTTLDANYENWVVDGYRVMYAKDVPNGQVGSTNNNECSGDAGSGEIQIPSEYGNGGYTVTEIDRINWDKTADLYPIYERWLAAGGQYDDGIAVLDGRYLIACTSTFGTTGDNVDFYLENGTVIHTIVFDEKSQVVEPWDDDPANKWGHDDGANIIEFQVSSNAFRNQYGGYNPGNNGWHMEWAGSRVASATNLGKGAAPVDNGGTTSSKGAYCKNGVAYGLRSTGKNDDIAKMAVALAATASPDSQLHAPGHAGTRLDDPRLQDFYDVMDETIRKYPFDDPNNPTTHNNHALASCVQAAAGVIRATVDPDIDSSAPYGFEKYLTENTEKWVLVEELNPTDILDEHCQPGDVLVAANMNCEFCAGHAAIYVGNKLTQVKFPGSNGNVYEANYSTAGYPYINYYNTSGYKFKVFRPTGKGTFIYPFIDITKYLDKYNW